MKREKMKIEQFIKDFEKEYHYKVIYIQLFSIYKWFSLLKKGETGAIDILFSLFRKDTQVFNEPKYTLVLKENYRRFYNRNLHSFLGYCVGQSKVYNIRGERFNELHSFVEYLSRLAKEHGAEKLESIYPLIEELFTKQKYKYIKFVSAPTSRGAGEAKEGIYFIYNQPLKPIQNLINLLFLIL